MRGCSDSARKPALNFEQETAGDLPDGPPANGGMGMMTSFGEGIKLTPLQLAATVSAIANGGTLYWLQYPRSQAEVEKFVPRVKRHLPIQDLIPELKPGMLGAVEYGTARRAAYDPNEPIFGKTGHMQRPRNTHPSRLVRIIQWKSATRNWSSSSC